MKSYEIRLKPRAQKELKHLSEDQRQRVIEALKKLKDGLAGDVRHLTNFSPEYRLRVGDYRVLFTIEDELIIVYRVRPRRDAYR